MNSRQQTTLASWYLGELGGEAMFRALATRSSDRARALKWETLAALEHETGRRIGEALIGSQEPLPTESDGDPEDRIVELTARPWNEQMTWLRDIAADALEEMTREASLLPLEMRELVEFVLAHERALVDFATWELAGNESESLKCVQRLLEAQRPKPG